MVVDDGSVLTDWLIPCSQTDGVLGKKDGERNVGVGGCVCVCVSLNESENVLDLGCTVYTFAQTPQTAGTNHDALTRSFSSNTLDSHSADLYDLAVFIAHPHDDLNVFLRRLVVLVEVAAL